MRSLLVHVFLFLVTGLGVLPAAAVCVRGDELAGARERYRAAEGAEARIAALEGIAALDDPAAPRAEIARALAAALDDPEPAPPRPDRAEREARRAGRSPERPPSVRARAVELLGAAHPGVAVAKLAPRTTQWETELRETAVELARELESPLRRGGAERLKERNERLLRLASRTIELVPPRDAAVVVLGRLADDRAVAALTEILATRLSTEDAVGHGPAGGHEVVDGLLALGSRPAFAAVCRVFEAWPRQERDRERELSRRRRERSGSMPRDFPGGREAWKEREEARLAKLVESQEAELERAREWVRGVAERVRGCAAAHGLEPAPAALDARAWSGWAGTALEPLPPSLGRLVE